jgi:glycosyltransferase involved in cell wall biosynthesis
MRFRSSVVIVTDHLKESGGSRVVHEAAQRLPAHGLSTELFVLLRSHPDEAVVTPAPGVRVRYAGRRTARLRSALLPGLAGLVASCGRARTVLSGSEVGYSLLLGWVAARLTRRPFVVLVQAELSRAMAEWVPPALHRITRWVHAHVELAICVSPGLVDDLLATGLPRERIDVVEVGIDVDRILADVAGARSAPLAPPPYFLAAGRLGAQKGFDVLIRAFALARDRLGGVHLVIAGDGPDRSQLMALADELGVADVVSFPGFVDDLHPAFAGAELFVLSSRYEGMGGLVLLEALAHGVPIVATDCMSGPRLLLEDGRLGQLVPVEDAAALAEALAAHVAEPRRLRSLARGGPARAREFGPDRWVGALAEALSTVRPRARRPRRTGP